MRERNGVMHCNLLPSPAGVVGVAEAQGTYMCRAYLGQIRPIFLESVFLCCPILSLYLSCCEQINNIPSSHNTLKDTIHLLYCRRKNEE